MPSVVLPESATPSTTPGALTIGADGRLRVAGVALSAWYGRIIESDPVEITEAVTATANRMHIVSGTSADYYIDLPSVATVGTVVGFIVKGITDASKVYTLRAGVGVNVGRLLRYFPLVHTNVVLLVSDGTRWLTLVEDLVTPWAVQETLSISAVTTPPTAPSSWGYNRVHWCRRGKTMLLRYEWQHSSNAGAAAGSGDYLYGLPLGVGADTGSVIPVYQNVSAAVDAVYAMGNGDINNGTNYARACMVWYSSTGFRIKHYDNASGAAGYQGSASFPLNSSQLQMRLEAEVPIAGW